MLSGVTVIAHGYQFTGNAPNGVGDWMYEMGSEIAQRLGERGGDAIMYDLCITDRGAFNFLSKRGDRALAESESAEAIVLLDWADASNNGISTLEPFVSTWEVAASSVGSLMAQRPSGSTSLAFAELPIHLIGHSRGASAMAALAWEFGRRGIWVDQLTALDAHPYDSRDASMMLTSNVVFADSYWRDDNVSLTNPWGESVSGAANVDLNPLTPDIFHSDPLIGEQPNVHMYYRGTIDTNVGYASWYSSLPRNQQGFAFSRLGGANRTSALARQGLLSSFGGAVGSRFVPSPLGAQWPNVADIQFGTSSFEIGETASVQLKYGDRDSGAVVSVFVDSDENPYNDNSEEVATITVGQADLASAGASFSTVGVPPGTYRLGAKVTDGTRTRYAYGVRDFVVTAPAVVGGQHRLFFPEGYRSGTIDEYVPMVNPGTSPVTYEVWARYETGVRDQRLWSGTIPPRTRAGIEVALKDYPASALVREGVPYALEIRSSARIGATMSHYDFGVATGEAFTSELSGFWTFPQVVKQSGSVLDFLTVYNPHDVGVQLSATIYPESGAPVTVSWGVEALRRSGINFDAEAWAPVGRFAVVLTSNKPVVASLSHYETTTGKGFITLGEAASATNDASVPYADLVASSAMTVAIANAGSESVVVNLTVHEEGAAPRALVDRTIASRGRLSLTHLDLGLGLGKRGYVEVHATHPVAVSSSVDDAARADALGMPGATRAARSWSFADGFFLSATAGVQYFETLAVGNPLPVEQRATIEHLFEDGTVATTTIVMPAKSSQTISLHREAALLERGASHGGEVRFATVVTGEYAVLACMTHWDLFYQGGWATLGTPMDVTYAM